MPPIYERYEGYGLHTITYGPDTTTDTITDTTHLRTLRNRGPHTYGHY